MDIAIDIETTGLSPWDSRVTTVALVREDDGYDVFDDPDNELNVLEEFERYMRLTQIGMIPGWNLTEFDLPYLAVRMVLNGVDMPPHLIPSGALGKYGKPRYNGTWYGAVFRDLAYHYQSEAEEAGVKWSLKPFAEYKGLGKGIEVDFSQKVRVKDGYGPCKHPREFGGNEHEYDVVYREAPFTILDLDKKDRMNYCLSDARLAMGLHKLEPAIVVKGQAVMFDGKTTFL